MTLSRHTEESPDSPFDRIRRVDENDNEYWVARELMPFLGYPRWNEFKVALERRKEKRLVNGTNQSVWCYKVCGELDEVISSFFGGEQ